MTTADAVVEDMAGFLGHRPTRVTVCVKTFETYFFKSFNNNSSVSDILTPGSSFFRSAF